MNFLSRLFSKKSEDLSSSKIDDNIVVAEVQHFEKHPNADRLRVVKLSIGDREVEPVVCGAANFNIGDKVVLALPGANIPRSHRDPEQKGFVLEKATIRGVESQGMICSAFELNLGPESDKPEILILKPDAPVGGKFSADLIE